MVLRLFVLVFILQGLIACDSEDLPDTTNPANLEVVVNIADDGSGYISIIANADNAIEYQLFIGANEDPTASNSTGEFDYTFDETGNYQIEIRAYGSSGRYVKEIRQVSVTVGEEVSIEDGYITPLEYDGYSLIWNDEFNGNTINTNNWTFEIGNGCPNLCGWGNNELQYYRQENAWVDGETLVIEARNENYMGSTYTSARMKTQGKQSFQYGRIDIRALLPKGQGIWPALWMLGENISTISWPACGEIDIMEMIGGSGRENETHGTVHWDNEGHNYIGGSYTPQSGTFADEYHVFTIIWDENSIKWLVNDTQFYEIDITPEHMSEFHQNHFFIFNIAVGGNWPGDPDQTTIFPQQMKVDYIRVFQ